MANALLEVVFLVMLIFNTCGCMFVSAISDTKATPLASTIVADVGISIENLTNVPNLRRRCKTRDDCSDYCPIPATPFCLEGFCECMRPP